jgi:hypothetical protein
VSGKHKKRPNEGQRRLNACGIVLAELSRRLNVPLGTIGNWKSGRGTPQPEERGLLRDYLSIPVWAWDEPPIPPSALRSPTVVLPQAAQEAVRIVHSAGLPAPAPPGPPPPTPDLRALPQAAWDAFDRSEAAGGAELAGLELPPDQGIRGLMVILNAYQSELAREAGMDRRDRIMARMAALHVALAKLQREQPVVQAAPDLDYSKLDYQQWALLDAADRLRAHLVANPSDWGRAPVPKQAPRLCVVDGLRGAALGVVAPDGWVTLVAPDVLEPAALAGLCHAGWAPPARPRGHYEHEDEKKISVAPRGGER